MLRCSSQPVHERSPETADPESGTLAGAEPGLCQPAGTKQSCQQSGKKPFDSGPRSCGVPASWVRKLQPPTFSLALRRRRKCEVAAGLLPKVTATLSIRRPRPKPTERRQEVADVTDGSAHCSVDVRSSVSGWARTRPTFTLLIIFM